MTSVGSNSALQNSHEAPPQRPAARIEDVTRVTLRPLGSALPLGFFTVAVATALAGSLQLGLINSKAAIAIGLLFIPAFLLQFVVAIFALLSRDPMAGTVMGTFAGSWGVSALAFTLHPADTNQALAVFFFLFAIFAAMMAYAAIPKRAMQAVLMVAVPRFFFAGLYEATQSTTIERIAGGFGFLLAVVALYTAFALMLEDMRGKTVLPTGRQGPARGAIEGELSDQLVGLEHTAGVRRTL